MSDDLAGRLRRAADVLQVEHPTMADALRFVATSIEADREAMRMAVEALERAKFELRGVTPTQDIDAAIAALRESLK